MVCDDCKSQLSTLSAPDPWKAGGSSLGGAARKIDENKALRKGIRSKCAHRRQSLQLEQCMNFLPTHTSLAD